MTLGTRFWLGLFATLALAVPLALAYAPALSELHSNIAAVSDPGAGAAYAPGVGAWTARALAVALSGVGIGVALLAYLAFVILPRR